jgi:hypothetical protein
VQASFPACDEGCDGLLIRQVEGTDKDFMVPGCMRNALRDNFASFEVRTANVTAAPAFARA